MSEYIKDSIEASNDEEMLSSYDKEWETREWGIYEGYGKGKEETEKEMVKNMLNDKLSIEKIMKYSGLTEEEIKKINETN